MKNLRNYLNVYLFQVVKGTAGLVGDALTFKWAQASMAQVAVNTVVVVEVKFKSIFDNFETYYLFEPLQVACWFFIGECIGKGSLVGYNV